MAGGRPLKFHDPVELQEKIDEYFAITKENDYRITGLALYLDTSRETLINYEERDEFFDAIKRAKTKIEGAWEKRLIQRGNAGDIFALKNFGWKDKQEVVSENLNTNVNLDTSIDATDPTVEAIIKETEEKLRKSYE